MVRRGARGEGADGGNTADAGFSPSDMMAGPRDRRMRDKPLTPNFDWITSDAPHKQLAGIIRRLILNQNDRLVQNTKFASLYANQDFLRGTGPIRGAGPGGLSARPNMPRQTLNLIKVYADTLAGKLVQSNSRVQAVTVQGDWETFKLARKIDRILDSTFLQGRLFRECSKFVIDGLNVGNGYLYVGEQDGKVTYERWYYNEVFVDQLDAMYGQPSMLFRIRYMYPENALGLWGTTQEKCAAIENAPRAQPPAFAWTPYEAGMIEVFEAWALELPHRKGRHVLCTVSGVLADEPYAEDKFPVVNFRVSDLPLGWYGQGFIAHAGETQVWLNRVLDIMARAAHLGMAPFWVVAGNADISIKQLNNAEGHIVTSNGPAPKWEANKPFHEAAPAYAELLMRQLGIMYGISDIESAGAMPLNRLDSNPALIQAQDMWMARHTILLKNWSEEVFMDIAERTMQVAQRIAKREGSYPIVATARGRAWAMDWSDFVDMKEEAYRLTLGAENMLPLTPAARKKMVLEMADQGLLSREQATQMMMGSPDLESITAQIAAFENNADWICEQLMEGKTEGKDFFLSELQKPEVVLQRVRAAGLNAHEFGAPDQVVMNFELFAATLTSKIQATQAALMPPQGVMNGPASPAGSFPPAPAALPAPGGAAPA